MVCKDCGYDLTVTSGDFCPVCGAKKNTEQDQNPYQNPYNTYDAHNISELPPGPQMHSGKATASMVLGIIGLIAWCFICIGLPITIVGLILGVIAMKGSNRGMAIAGVTMSIIGLVATIIFTFLTVFSSLQGW